MKAKHVIIYLLLVIVTSSCIRDEAPNAEADILSCRLPGITMTTSPIINNNSVTLFVTPGTNISALAPEFTLTSGATITPASGTERNFNSPQEYQVTAADGIWKKTYAISVIDTELAKPVYSPERAQPLGVSRQGMAQSIQIGTTGMTLGEYRQGDQVLPILLKDNTVDSFRINDLRTLPVFGTGNETTSLEQVVSDFDFQYRFSNVKDYNRQMVMMAQCDPRRGVNAIAAFNQVWSQVQKEIKVPEGYTMKYFGEQESQVESNEALAKNLPLTFFLMFVTLLFLFKTYRKPPVILLMLPLIFIGIVLGLLLLGKSFDFFSILGLLGLIGMNIKNAIVLVEQIDLEAKMGKKPLDAVVSATTSRIVPVAMASGTTILGMLPLLFDAMFGGMAATIMGGLLVASILTLFVLPVAYCAIQRIKD